MARKRAKEASRNTLKAFHLSAQGRCAVRLPWVKKKQFTLFQKSLRKSGGEEGNLR